MEDDSGKNVKDNVGEAERKPEPQLPWEVPSKEGESSGQPVKASRNSKAIHFAEVGKIDVLMKIKDLRDEMERLYSDKKDLRQRVNALETECTELKSQVTSLEGQIETMQQREQKWQEEREQLLAQISDLQSKWQLAESEKEDLKRALDASETVINEIAEALNWKH